MLTPNRPLVHTSFMYPKLNIDGFFDLNGSLEYEDSTQEVEWNSLHVQRGIGKAEGTGIMHIRYTELTFFRKSFSDLCGSIDSSNSSLVQLPYACHYNPRFVYFLPHF